MITFVQYMISYTFRKTIIGISVGKKNKILCRMSGGAKDEMKVSRDVMVALKEVKENQKKREEFGMCGCG